MTPPLFTPGDGALDRLARGCRAAQPCASRARAALASARAGRDRRESSGRQNAREHVVPHLHRRRHRRARDARTPSRRRRLQTCAPMSIRISASVLPTTTPRTKSPRRKRGISMRALQQLLHRVARPGAAPRSPGGRPAGVSGRLGSGPKPASSSAPNPESLLAAMAASRESRSPGCS